MFMEPVMQVRNDIAEVSIEAAELANAAMGWSKRILEMGVAFLKRALIASAIVVVGSVGLSLLVTLPSGPAEAADRQVVARGKYLVGIAGCNDCHTPGYFFGKPDMTRFLGGSEVGFEIPGLGVFHGPNLTPDRETGLGTWTAAQIAAAITKGVRPDGRKLAPIMPWHAFASLTSADTRAIVAYLQSLPPVKNKVPGPFGPTEKATSFVMKVVPPEGATTLPK
jgi:mono/diheme cytochrome c family protein